MAEGLARQPDALTTQPGLPGSLSEHHPMKNVIGFILALVLIVVLVDAEIESPSLHPGCNDATCTKS